MRIMGKTLFANFSNGILFLFLLLFFLFSPQIKANSTDLTNKFSKIILNEQLSSLKVTDSLMRFIVTERNIPDSKDIDKLINLYQKRFNVNSSLQNEFGLTFLKVEVYIANRQVGKALVTINDFYKKVNDGKNDELLLRTYKIYSDIYDAFDMREEMMRYERKWYFMHRNLEKSAFKLIDAKRMFAWSYTKAGAQLNNQVYMDSAVIILRNLITELEKDIINGRNINHKLYDAYGIYMMNLARLKRYHEIINVGKKAAKNLQLFDSLMNGLNHWDSINFRSYYGRIGMAYCALRNRDSAFYFLNLPMNFDNTKTSGSALYPKNGKYYSFYEMSNIVQAHMKFNEYKEAANLLNIALFSKHKMTDEFFEANLFELGVEVFKKAGMPDKYIICFEELKKITDIQNKKQLDDYNEATRTNTEIQLKDAEETSRLEKEKIDLERKKEQFEKKVIIIISISGIILLVSFLTFLYNRFTIIRKQKEIIETQKDIVETKNREVTQSIKYALRIQNAILPTQKIVKQYLENSFVLYKPKDIVAGDFYWMETTNDLILFAACDCTGHGVPGAMVSVVCHNALNRAVKEFGLTQPAAILDKTAELVIENFSKSEEDIKDGMDISLCSYNAKTNTLQWAGANNPLWLLQNGEIIETKADKQPIGMNEGGKPFTNHTFNLNTADTIYLFTDGFADQFGGETGQKKLTRKRFKDLILSIQSKTIQEQGIALDKFITDYRKEIEQIDDILVMGVKV